MPWNPTGTGAPEVQTGVVPALVSRAMRVVMRDSREAVLAAEALQKNAPLGSMLVRKAGWGVSSWREAVEVLTSKALSFRFFFTPNPSAVFSFSTLFVSSPCAALGLCLYDACFQQIPL